MGSDGLPHRGTLALAVGGWRSHVPRDSCGRPRRELHTLHAPGSFAQWIGTFLGYAIWSFVQQFLMQGYFLLRLLQLLPNPKLAAITTALIFTLAHLPNPILTPLTLLWGVAACLVFLRHRNLYPLAVAHAIFGICIAITIPGPWYAICVSASATSLITSTHNQVLTPSRLIKHCNVKMSL